MYCFDTSGLNNNYRENYFNNKSYQDNCHRQIKWTMSFFANNLFIYNRKDIINLFSKQLIMDKIGFLKGILSDVSN